MGRTLTATLQPAIPRSRAVSPLRAVAGSFLPTWQRIVSKIFQAADIEVNGARRWDIQVHDFRFYRRALFQGSLGLGESYMDGWWDCQAVDEFIYRILHTMSLRRFPYLSKNLWLEWRGRLLNLQTSARAFRVGEQHYDAGEELYDLMLDKRKVYTCGYWAHAKDLDEAQEAKLDLVCRKLGLAPGMMVLDIGCGWGSFLKYAAERYGIKGVGVTISKNQFEQAKRTCQDLPVDIRFQDYRETEGQFDRIVSLGMFEHVGHHNYATFMRVARQCLKNDGLFLLHTIMNNVSVFHYDPWMDKYIFPNAQVPSLQQITRSLEDVFIIEDCHNLNVDYDRTLMAWWENFENAWSRLSFAYDHRFYRMWRYYLLMSAAAFRARNKQVCQLVLSPYGRTGGYQSLR